MAKATIQHVKPSIPSLVLELEPDEVEALVALLGLCSSTDKTEPMNSVNRIYVAATNALRDVGIDLRHRRTAKLGYCHAHLNFDWT